MTERQIAATWLREVLSFVENIQDDEHVFSFGVYFERHSCTTVACMEGWIYFMYPKRLNIYRNSYVKTLDGNWFYPEYLGIPISKVLWRTLTLPSDELPFTSSFKQVKEFWLKIISQIEAGELDHKLIII